jgi:hypothetical protein
MPKNFDINDAINGGNDLFYEQYFGGDEGMEQLKGVAMTLMVLVIIYCIYNYATKEGATNSNSAVALTEFSAGSVGSGTSAPMDLYGTSVYARNLQDVDKMTYHNLDPNAPAGAKGSASYAVLNSPIMGCSSTDTVQNPWAWMEVNNQENDKVATEALENPNSCPTTSLGKRMGDEPLTKALMGY